MIRISFRYPLSESIAPSGTAWGAEGLRGNEANENNSMVLALARARKGQSGRRFAQEDMAAGFHLRVTLLPGTLRPSAPLMRNTSCLCSDYGVTLRVICRELVIGFAPPVVALIVTA